MFRMKVYKLSLVFIVLSSVFSCSRDEVPNDVEINNFVWKGLNAYYLWQENIPDLSDTRFSSDQQLYNYLSGFDSPKTLFENLIYKKNVVDKWSWIADNYTTLEEALQGTSLTTGMEFEIIGYEDQSANMFGYVRYVNPGTDAKVKGVKRGMIFNEVNGVRLTKSNYRELLFSKTPSITITLADYNSGSPIATTNTISLTKDKYTENPIHISKTLNIDGKKIGYLMYNAFVSSFDDQLNQSFSTFKSEGITDLIIDLRYNYGGFVKSAARLGSMITGQFTNEIFAKQLWNNKYMNVVNPDFLIDRFPSTLGNNTAINSLNLSRIYFITTASTASASELIINSLDPYIDVKTIGTKTRGKYVASITLYDSPTFSSKNNINPNHNWAMQPIVSQTFNKDDKNQKEGIIPFIEIEEDYGNLGNLGEIDEPLLQRTIQLITTGSRSSRRGKIARKSLSNRLRVINNSKSRLPTYNNMYIGELE